MWQRSYAVNRSRRKSQQLLLSEYYDQINAIILSRQHPITGLLPASTAINAHGDYTHAWVRDNVYSILSVWGLALAFRRTLPGDNRTFMLEQSVVKLMRGLLTAMMKQASKVEAFKHSQAALDALHAKYDTNTGDPVVGDNQWGHLQLDATSLFLLMLAQMIASGLRIIFTYDEVDFIQNLVYYVARTYRTPDYGVWERGHKINHGITEVNASSVGIAKAALEALRDFNLFGQNQGKRSCIHVMDDDIARARATLESLLPRESDSKEVDAALLSIISFPAFAVEDNDLAEKTRQNILQKLLGNYGCKRFLLDGHQTVLEDTNRLHYEPFELTQFEHIESEWPLFFTYLMLDELFRGNRTEALKYQKRLDDLLVERNEQRLLPELYYVPFGSIAEEKKSPHSQQRLPNENVPLVWAQSLYLLGQLILDGLLSLSDIDPLARHTRLGHQRNTVVQVGWLAETATVKALLKSHGIAAETLEDIKPIEIRRAADLVDVYRHLGHSSKLKLSGRPPYQLGVLATSTVYQLDNKPLLFIPHFLDRRDFYLVHDNLLMVEHIKAEIAYHFHHWDQNEPPLMVILATAAMLKNEGHRILVDLANELRKGSCNGIPVRLGKLSKLVANAEKCPLDFISGDGFSSPPIGLEDAKVAVTYFHPAETSPLTSVAEQRWGQEQDTPTLWRQLFISKNLYEQILLLSQLHHLNGPDYAGPVPGLDGAYTIRYLVENIYNQATNYGFWAITRQAAGLLQKFDATLEDAVAEIVLRQKQVSVGRAYSQDAVITKPLSVAEILQKITQFCGDDEREHVLTQELLLYLATLIKTEPKLFGGMLTLRVGHMLLLLVNQISRQQSVTQGEAFEILLSRSPSALFHQLRTLLASYKTESAQLIDAESLHKVGNGELVWVYFPPHLNQDEMNNGNISWRSWREHHGVVSRLPDTFYPAVWRILARSKGIVIGDKLDVRNRLENGLRLEMTANEKNFALRVEYLLNKIHAPEYRQLVIETLSAVDEVFKANLKLRLDDYLVLDVLIGHAVRLAWINLHPNQEYTYDVHRPAAWAEFYETPPHQVANSIMAAISFLLEAGETDHRVQGWT